jgi:hypothetical protein
VSYPNEPTHSPYGERLRERTQPLALDDASYGFAHAYLCEALSRPFEEVQAIFDPEGDVPPIAPLLDPELCPDWALTWLAQFVGLHPPAGYSPDTIRTLIVSASGFARGTPAAMKAAAGVYLTGSKTVYFRERDGSAYRLEVLTLASETPDAAKVETALRNGKPGGIVLSYRVVNSWDYQLMTETGGTYAEQSAAFTSYQNLQERIEG